LALSLLLKHIAIKILKGGTVLHIIYMDGKLAVTLREEYRLGVFEYGADGDIWT